MRRLLLGIYLPLILILPSIFFVVALTFIRSPQVPAYILGYARLHNHPVNAMVFIDGEEIQALVYSTDEYRNPSEGRTFLVYPMEMRSEFPVTMIDIDRRDIGLTNFDDSKYKMFPGRNLIQMSGAYAVIWASDKVKWGYDPKMTVEGNKITYFEEKLIGEKKIEIIFENNL